MSDKKEEQSLVAVQPTNIDIHKLDDEALLDGAQRLYRETQESHREFRRDYAVLLMFCQEIIDRFGDQHLAGEGRNGKPTVTEAFKSRGMNYNTVKSWFKRHGQNIFPDRVKPTTLQLTEGDKVKNDEDGVVGTVVTAGDTEVSVLYEGDPTPVKEPIYKEDGEPRLAKVAKKVAKHKVGDLIYFVDKGAEYAYLGDLKFERTSTPTDAERANEAAAARRDLDKLVEEKPKPKVSRGKKAVAADPLIPLDEIVPPKGRCKKNALEAEPWIPFFARTLGDKFTVFRGGEVEFTIRTAQGTIWDTMPEAEAHAGRLNAKYAPKAEGASA